MIEITWLGHATTQLRLESGEVLLLDPWTEGNPKFPKSHQFDRIDIMAVSHGHGDHIGDAARLAKQFKPKVFSMVEVAEWLHSKGVENPQGFNKGGTVNAGAVKLTMTHALHSSGIQDGDHKIYGGDPAGFIITLPDKRSIYFAGDTSIFSDMALLHELYQPELAFLPIGDHYTMDPLQAAYACRLLKVKTVIPIHYGTFPILTGTPEQLDENIKKLKLDTKVWTLTPGEPVKW